MKPELVEILFAESKDGTGARKQASGNGAQLAAGQPIVVASSTRVPSSRNNSTDTDEPARHGDGHGDNLIYPGPVISMVHEQGSGDGEPDYRRRPVKFVCRSRGSRPAALLEWFWHDRSVGGSMVNNSSSASNRRGGETRPIRSSEQLGINIKSSISELRTGWAPSGGGGGPGSSMDERGPSNLAPADPSNDRQAEYFSTSELVFQNGLGEAYNQLELMCRATNEQLPPNRRDSSLEARTRLDIKCKYGGSSG